MRSDQEARVAAEFTARCEKDFLSAGTPMHTPTPEARSAYALEYIAFQLGRIRQMMEADRNQAPPR